MADSIQYEVLENNQIRFEAILEELQKNQKDTEGRIDVNARKLEEAVAGMEARILDFMQRWINKEKDPEILTQDFKDYKILKSSFCLDLGNAAVTRPLENDEKVIESEANPSFISNVHVGSITNSYADVSSSDNLEKEVILTPTEEEVTSDLWVISKRSLDCIQSKIDLDAPQVRDVRNYRIIVATWNVAGRSFPSYLNLEDWLHTSPPADIYVLGFQEIVPLNVGNVLGTEDNGPAKKWLALIRKTLNSLPGTSGDCYTPSPVGDPITELDADFEGSMGQKGSFFFNRHFFQTLSRSMRRAENDISGPQPRLDRRFSVCDRVMFGNLPSDYNPNVRWGGSSDEEIEEGDSPCSTHCSPASYCGSVSMDDRESQPGQSRYCFVASKQMVGIFLTVWIKSDLRDDVRNMKVSCVGRGLIGYLGNKGSISIRVSLHQTSFCFNCSHLTFGQKEGDDLRRNADVMEILRKTRFPRVRGIRDENSPQIILEHDRIIWLGDLNYRIALSYRIAKALVEIRNWKVLLENDQPRIESLVLNDQTIAIMVLMALFTTFITTPLVMAVYKPAKRTKEVDYKYRIIERKNPNTELRILACFHSARNIPSLINILKASRGTEKQESLCVYSMHLMELSERSSAIQIVHNARRNGLPFWNKGQSEANHVIFAFEAFHKPSKVLVKPMTSISSFSDMHEDINSTAKRKMAAIIILPLDKHQRLDGSLETTRPEYCVVNIKVLEQASCSVAIFVESGLGGNALVPSRNVSYHTVVLFFGGPDDREALAYGARMAEHPGISLTVVHFPVFTESGEEKVQIEAENGQRSRNAISADEEAIAIFKDRFSEDDSVKYEERAVVSSEEAIVALSGYSRCNLLLVGRKPDGELALALNERRISTLSLDLWGVC